MLNFFKIVTSLFLLVIINLNFAQAKEVISIKGNPPSNYKYTWINAFLTGYTLNYDSYYIKYCDADLKKIVTPPNHRLYKIVNEPIILNTRNDPYGRGYYHDKALLCSAEYINDSTDCINLNKIYAPGDTRVETVKVIADCETVTTTYVCQQAAWKFQTQSYRRISGCIPR